MPTVSDLPPEDAASEQFADDGRPPVLYATFDLPREGVAKDAPPLIWDGAGLGALAVFDGMGGAGARKVDGPDGRRTAAWYAARIAAETVKEWLSGFVDQEAPVDLAAELSLAIHARLAAASETRPGTGLVVRSSLIRNYPTTAALLLFEARGGRVESCSFWAGDSRAYALTPHLGLQQLSRDDSRAGGDPMQALRDDSPLSNMLTADAPNPLRSASQHFATPVLLLTASDGCFGSLESPMHFELVLLRALDRALDPQDWQAELSALLLPVASDDMSLSAAFIGWPTLAAAAVDFRPRLAWLESVLAPLEQMRAQATQHRGEAQRLAEQAGSHLQTVWQTYRTGYLAALSGGGDT